MERAGFPLPATVASFLMKRELAEGAAVIVDEAGQIGGRQMLELIRLARERNARLILSGDTRQHGAIEASDALLAIERHSGVRPIELHNIRRQDPARGQTVDEREHIKQYRQAVKLAADGKFDESFSQLDKMSAVVSCGLADQAVKLADEYLGLAEKNVSAVVVSQTWAEVHRVNEHVRDKLKSKGLLGANDVMVQTLEKIDLTNAQKRDKRFYPSDAVIVFNQKVRRTDAGAKGKLGGIVKASVLVEVNGRFVMVSNKLLDKITVCRPQEIKVAEKDRLHLKANRKLAAGGRVTNGELVTVKSVGADGKIKLTDGRVLDKSYREFSPGYAVTSYGSQPTTQRFKRRQPFVPGKHMAQHLAVIDLIDKHPKPAANEPPSKVVRQHPAARQRPQNLEPITWPGTAYEGIKWPRVTAFVAKNWITSPCLKRMYSTHNPADADPNEFHRGEKHYRKGTCTFAQNSDVALRPQYGLTGA